MREMTIRERMLSVYNNRMPDRFPVGIYSRYLPRGSWERQLRNSGLGIIAYYPICTLMSPPWHMGSGFLSEVKGVDFEVSYRWENGNKIEVRTFKTKVGTVAEHIIKDPAYGSDWISKHYITNKHDYKVLQYITENTVFSSNEKELVAMRQNLCEDGVVLGRIDRTPFQKMLIELAGPERFLIDISTGLKAAEDLLEVMGQRHVESLDMISQSSAEVIWQPENVTGDITPPTFFKKYCMPYYKIAGEKCSASDKPYVVHLDGRLKSLKDKLNECPFSCIESYSYPIMGGDISLTDLRSNCPGKVVLPNFPSSLSDSGKESIRSFLDEILDEAGCNQPFMLQISEDLPAAYLQEVARVLTEYFGE